MRNALITPYTLRALEGMDCEGIRGDVSLKYFSRIFGIYSPLRSVF